MEPNTGLIEPVLRRSLNACRVPLRYRMGGMPNWYPGLEIVPRLVPEHFPSASTRPLRAWFLHAANRTLLPKAVP